MYDQDCDQSPLRAHDALMAFAAVRGEAALRLASHAALPQVLRPDLLHLIRLNFVPEAGQDVSVEADVLFAPFCQDLGNGYYRFATQVRLQLLRGLDPDYPTEPTPRSVEVARFLLAYLDQRGRNATGTSDRVFLDYLEVERWSALGFLDPDATAQQLASALRSATASDEVAARVRFTGLANALSTPLARYGRLLAYTAGLEALENLRTEEARRIFGSLGDAEVPVGQILLPSPQRLLRTRSPAQAEAPPATPPNPEPQGPESHQSSSIRSTPKLCISYSRRDQRWADLLLEHLGEYIDAGDIELKVVEDIGSEEAFARELRERIEAHQTIVVVLSAHYLGSNLARGRNVTDALAGAVQSGRLRLTWVLSGQCQWQHTVLAHVQAAYDPGQPLDHLTPVARRAALATAAKRILELTDRSASRDSTATEPTHAHRATPERVLISYRRGDTPDDANRLHELLTQRWPGIPISRDPSFEDRMVPREVARGSLLLVLIGPHWLESQNTFGTQRIRDEDDWLRAELRQAFLNGAWVLPVLVDDATMPSAGDLPPDLEPLTQLTSFSLHDRTWDEDCETVCQFLETEHLTSPPVYSFGDKIIAPPDPEPATHTTSNRKVYLASVGPDLVELRHLVENLLHEAGNEVVPGNNTGWPKNASDIHDDVLAQLRGADVFVGILGLQLGWIPPLENPENFSLFELQYEAARRARVPLLLFAVGHEPPEPTNDGQRREYQRLLESRRRLTSQHVVQHFDSFPELALALERSLRELPPRAPTPPQETPVDLPEASAHASDSPDVPRQPPPGWIVWFVGHSIDRPHRRTPRFPAQTEGAARAAIAETLTRLVVESDGLGIGLGLAGGSDGGDILFHEVCAELRITTRMVLPISPEGFVGTLLDAGRDWMERFEHLVRNPSIQVIVGDASPDTEDANAPNSDDDPWAITARAIRRQAFAGGAERAVVIALWNGEDGAPGGPADVVRMAKEAGARVVVIDPRRLPTPNPAKETPPRTEPVAYLCYAPQDAEAAAQVTRELRLEGIQTWEARNLFSAEGAVEDSLRKVIANDIDYFVVLQSRHLESNSPGFALQEVHMALERRQALLDPKEKFIIPVSLKGAKPLPILGDQGGKAIAWQDGKGTHEIARQIREDWSRRRSGDAPRSKARVS